MEGTGEETLDGSSIQPVSSLRSRFEQMANAAPNKSAPPRPVSPKPIINSAGSPAPSRISLEQQNNTHTSRITSKIVTTADRENGNFKALLSPQHNGPARLSPSPPPPVRPRPVSMNPPAVTVQPPQSPQKVMTNLTISNSTAFLTTDTASPISGGYSPRHFRTPSRPSTPLESTNAYSLPSSRPPSPPPPRRSSELKRQQSSRGIPPPVNRAEKPKISSRPVGPVAIQTSMARSVTDGPRSPFGTPPKGDTSPQSSSPGPRFPRNHSYSSASVLLSQRSFNMPVTHETAIGKHQDEEPDPLKVAISPQITGQERPALPTRPTLSQLTIMPPPPPRRSMERTRSSVSKIGANDSIPSSPVIQKRVSSTPSQYTPPPRTHGRSMTVDRTSDRAPIEIRRQATISGDRPTFDPLSSNSQKYETAPLGQAEYPDSSNSNRRPPTFKGTRDIPTKYDARVFDVCGEYVCTSGHVTKVWNLLDGELVMILPHTENVKILSAAFKPGPNIRNEGARLWLGNNIGDLIEIDIATQATVASKAAAHTRREIIKIYRHMNELWTLDDGGTLHMWMPGSDGSPSLSNPSQSFRVPKGHTFSLVVVDELWHVAGKEIRVFLPSMDGAAQFQVLQRPLAQPAAGDITSGAVLDSQADNVYFGHVDGKISIYSRRDYTCIGIINISVYRIACLAGVGDQLWAGFSTGMIHVYDVSQKPWIVKKDWVAHREPLIGLIADRSSFWMLDRAQVISLGQDNMIRTWDGLLQDDWIDNEMQSQQHEFCQSENIKTLVMTWNAGASTPYHLQHSELDSKFFRELIRNSDCPDILVFGFQELVDLEDKKTTAKSFFKSKKRDPGEQEHMSHQYRDWRDFLTRCLDDYMPRDELYHLLHTASLVGLFTCIFVKASLRDRIRNVNAAEIKRGMGGLHGNKGALIVRFMLDDTSLCFINCHLAAGQSQTKDRNTDITVILESSPLPMERDASVRQDSYIGGGDGSMILDHEICVLNGDLNYRIDTMGRDTVVAAVKGNNLGKLLERDQLLASRRKNPLFKLRAFHELPITFAPTYKYDVGTDTYDTSEKKRAPAWCDRILYRGQNRIKQLGYCRHEVRVSDHRPVTGSFSMIIKTVIPQKRAKKWEECQRRLVSLREKLGDEARLDYLINVIGFDPATSKQMVIEGRKLLQRKHSL